MGVLSGRAGGDHRQSVSPGMTGSRYVKAGQADRSIRPGEEIRGCNPPRPHRGNGATGGRADMNPNTIWHVEWDPKGDMGPVERLSEGYMDLSGAIGHDIKQKCLSMCGESRVIGYNPEYDWEPLFGRSRWITRAQLIKEGYGVEDDLDPLDGESE